MTNAKKLIKVLASVASIVLASHSHAATTLFPVATTAAQEMSLSVASDGTNFLVGIHGDMISGSKSGSVGAQLVDGSGNLIGQRIATGRTRRSLVVGFAASSYLMIWEDDSTTDIYGQLIDTSGVKVGNPFAINTTKGVLQISGHRGMACNSTGCWVLWYEKDTKAVYARHISPAGVFLSDETTVESATYGVGGRGGVAMDGNGNLMGVYDNDLNIRASINGPTIKKNTFLVAGRSAGCARDEPDIAFDGSNYLVVWIDNNDCTSTSIHTRDVLGQFVDVAGNLIGTAFKLNSANTNLTSEPFVVFDGSNYLVSWTDQRNDLNRNDLCDAAEGSCADIYGRYVSKSGALVGTEFVINNAAGDQLGGLVGYAGGKYFGVINTNFTSAPNTDTWGDVYGVFMTTTTAATLNLQAGWNLLGNGIDASITVASTFGDAAEVISVWSWSNASNRWNFYSPSMSSQDLDSYASGKGYNVLSTIAGGQGFWVNAKQNFSSTLPSGNLVTAAGNQLGSGWNLMAIGETKTPSQYNTAQNVISIWMWDAGSSSWYFHAPSLAAQGGSVMSDFIRSRGHLDFTTNNMTLGQGAGFWVNKQ